MSLRKEGIVRTADSIMPVAEVYDVRDAISMCESFQKSRPDDQEEAVYAHVRLPNGNRMIVCIFTGVDE